METIAPPSPQIEMALRFASNGWPVLPLRSRGKEPDPRHAPRGQYSATLDPDAILAWPANANVGLVMGPTSGLVCVDIDTPDGRERLEAQGCELDKTLRSMTANGSHHIYAIPPDITTEISFPLPRIGDVKSGGYIVSPPSVHPSGIVYSFSREMYDGEEFFVEPAPDWLLAMLRKRLAARGRALPTTAAAPSERARVYATVPRQVEEQMRRVRVWALRKAAEGECRHGLLVYIALRAAAHGMPPERTRETLSHWANEASKLKPRRIDADEVARAISWAYARPAGKLDTAIIAELHERLHHGK